MANITPVIHVSKVITAAFRNMSFFKFLLSGGWYMSNLSVCPTSGKLEEKRREKRLEFSVLIVTYYDITESSQITCFQ